MIVAVYVAATPTLTVLGASTDVEVESGRVVMVSTELVEPANSDAMAGENTTVRLTADAANEVEHDAGALAVRLSPLGPTTTFAHPSIGAPSSSKVTVPQVVIGLVLTEDITVALNVTDSLVTALVGDATKAVVVGSGPVGVGDAASAPAAPASTEQVTTTARTAAPISRRAPQLSREQHPLSDSTRSRLHARSLKIFGPACWT